MFISFWCFFFLYFMLLFELYVISSLKIWSWLNLKCWIGVYTIWTCDNLLHRLAHDCIQIRTLIQFVGIDLKVFRHSSPILSIKIVKCTAFRLTVFLVMRDTGNTGYPHLFLYVISPITVMSENLKTQNVVNPHLRKVKRWGMMPIQTEIDQYRLTIPQRQPIA